MRHNKFSVVGNLIVTGDLTVNGTGGSGGGGGILDFLQLGQPTYHRLLQTQFKIRFPLIGRCKFIKQSQTSLTIAMLSL